MHIDVLIKDLILHIAENKRSNVADSPKTACSTCKRKYKL